MTANFADTSHPVVTMPQKAPVDTRESTKAADMAEAIKRRILTILLRKALILKRKLETGR